MFTMGVAGLLLACWAWLVLVVAVGGWVSSVLATRGSEAALSCVAIEASDDKGPLDLRRPCDALEPSPPWCLEWRRSSSCRLRATT
jgi:hypothetical protein